jgi:hypothetical protein
MKVTTLILDLSSQFHGVYVIYCLPLVNDVSIA